MSDPCRTLSDGKRNNNILVSINLADREIRCKAGFNTMRFGVENERALLRAVLFARACSRSRKNEYPTALLPGTW